MSNQEKLWKTNKLICGDNLEELPRLPKKSVDLIYIDPPFFTHKQYEVIWKDKAEIMSFKDRWEGGIEHYIIWLTPRVQAIYELLKPTGSFYIHCDWHANAHIRIMLDKIFGVENFRNEIVWCYERAHPAHKVFKRLHDTILFYSKSDKWTFNMPRVPFKDGSWQRSDFKRPDGKIWKQKLKGKACPDWWTDIPSFATRMSAKERTGYPTQKPEALLKRIIEASSNKGDLVLDAFCGCGTTVAVAQQLERRWIGIDISPTAIKVIQRRLKRMLGAIEDINYVIIGMPTTAEALRELEPFEFQNRVVIDELRGNLTRKKVGDMGLDGYIPSGELWREGAGIGIQVKQSDKIGRNVVDNFETALKRAGYKKGYIVAFSFGKGAYEEVARIKNKGELEIKLITIEELLNKKAPL
jgi:DNA modification methylase